MGLIVDLFAGGGGASLGIRLALGRDPDVAINHDPEAVAMHAANHPGAAHFCQDVWQVLPAWAAKGRPVDLLWASPDCKHFSKAKGGKPREKGVRDLAWVVVEWARQARPAVIILENVEEFRQWGPLDAAGQPIKEKAGTTFDEWAGQIRRAGYQVEWRELRACDYGAPTIRKRIFLIARRDGLPIVWPEPTHGPGRPQPWRTAAECIDWRLPCPSIFERKKPLAEATQRRIAAGIKRFVIEAAEPFIVTYYGPKGEAFRGQGLADPLATQTTENRHALVAPFLAGAGGPAYGGKPVAANRPAGTILSENHQSLVAAFLAKHFTGVVGSRPGAPLGTETAGDHHSLITSHLAKLYGTCKHGQDLREPAPTCTAGGKHAAEVRALLIKYYGQAVGQPAGEALGTVTAHDRFGLVTVLVGGEPYILADIGLRMLQPRELFRAQGFPDSYRIDLEVSGRPLTKTAQVRLCGNSVCPPIAAALVRANSGRLAEREAA